jgi:outer membrane protein OmpA-like peptidoglycan-associated protein
MKNRLILLVAAISLSACATTLNTDRDELANARAAIAAAKKADAERCAPRTQAQAVAALYQAAHELTEGSIHPDETAELIAMAEAKGKEARRQAIENCKPKPKPKPVVVEIISLKGVNFKHDSAELTPKSMAILDEAVTTLTRRSDINIEVAAHTDSDGTDAYNLGLSDRRAASVRGYLVSHGIDEGRLTSRGYGEGQPIASNATKEGKAQNRRVELRVME